MTCPIFDLAYMAQRVHDSADRLATMKMMTADATRKTHGAVIANQEHTLQLRITELKQAIHNYEMSVGE